MMREREKLWIHHAEGMEPPSWSATLLMIVLNIVMVVCLVTALGLGTGLVVEAMPLSRLAAGAAIGSLCTSLMMILLGEVQVATSVIAWLSGHYQAIVATFWLSTGPH